MRESETIDVIRIEDQHGRPTVDIDPIHWVWVNDHPAHDAIRDALEAIRSELPASTIQRTDINQTVGVITAGENEAIYRITVPRESA